MNLIHLKYFQTVARIQNMTQAAHELHIAQPMLSTIINKLETELEVDLFDRIGRSIRLNEYGKAYLKRVNLALTTLEEGRREVTELAGLERGIVSLAATTLNRLSEVLASYLAKHPDANFKVTQASSEKEAHQLLENQEIDLFMTTEFNDRPDIVNVRLVTEEILVAIPTAHRFAGFKHIPLWKLAQESFISLRKGYSFRELTDRYCTEAGFTPHIICEGDEPAAIVGLVETGLGVAFVPAASRKASSSNITYLQIEEIECKLTFYLAWIEGRYLSRSAMDFRDHVIEHFCRKQNM